jgi:hypothetical protein
MVDPVVSVATALLRAQLPDVTLREGSSVMARVASRGEGHGVLVLAGIPLTAQLPDGVESGATLKLLVEEVGPERVVLKIEAQPAQPVNPLAAGPAPPRPEPPRLAVGEPPRRSGDDQDGGASVQLAFVSPALGRIDLRIDLATRAVQVGVEAPAGQAFEAADGASERLRASLEDALERPASVRVTPRREPLDVYA